MALRSVSGSGSDLVLKRAVRAGLYLVALGLPVYLYNPSYVAYWLFITRVNKPCNVWQRLTPAPSPLTLYLHKYVEPATWHHLKLTHIFARDRREGIAMKTHTVHVLSTQVSRCRWTHSLKFMIFFVWFFSFFWGKCKRVLWNSTWHFFVYLLICIYVHRNVEIYAYVIYFSYTQYNLCIDPPKSTPHPDQKYPPPKQHPALYKVNMYSTHTLQEK